MYRYHTDLDAYPTIESDVELDIYDCIQIGDKVFDVTFRTRMVDYTMVYLEEVDAPIKVRVCDPV